MKKILLFNVFNCFLLFAYSQGGKPDPSFGTNGIVTANLGKPVNNNVFAKKVLIGPDGSVYITTSSYIARRHANGSTDSTYGKAGFSSFSEIIINDAAIQADGKVVVAGSSNGILSVIRYNNDGRQDSTFGNAGRQIINRDNSAATALAIQKDGKIIVAGYATEKGGRFGDENSVIIFRLNANGSVDNSFLGGAFPPAGASSLAIEQDGKIVIGTFSGGGFGGFQGLIVVNSDGSLDNSFNGWGGIETPGDIQKVAIQSDGKILVSGIGLNNSNSENIILRYNPNGTVDSTFNKNGEIINSFSIAALVVDNNDKIVVAGASSLGRYNSNGSPDNSFAKSGIQENSFAITSATPVSDGKIVIAGSGFARYNNNGGLDHTFDGSANIPLPSSISGNTVFKRIRTQSDGKIVVVAHTGNDSSPENILARYNIDGSRDSAFGKNGIQVSGIPIVSLAVLSNDKILVAGDTSFALLNSDGTPDDTFGKNGIQHNNFAIEGVATQNDGKIVVVGTAATKDASGADYFGFAVNRYNASGNLDKSFSDDGKTTILFQALDKYSEGAFTVSADAYLVNIQSDGKIVVAGSAKGADDLGDNYMAGRIIRLNTNGSLDSSFHGVINDSHDGFEYHDHPTAMAGGDSDNIAVASVMESTDYGQVYITNIRTGKTITRLPYQPAGITSLVIEDDGKIIASENSEKLLRFNKDGKPDTTFGVHGAQLPKGNVNDMTISNTKLYTAGAISVVNSLGVVARYLLEDKSTPPTVSLTTPANKATYLAPAYFWLRATASDSDGSIRKVEFYNGATLLHTETATPYGFKMRNLPVGDYTFTAKAYDNTGLVTTSTPVHISIVPDKPPVVSIIKPLNNQSFAAPGYLHLEADAKDVDGKIVRVEFYKGSTLLATQYEAPYTYHWANIPAGTYSITAVAVDNWGAHTTSAPVTVRIKAASIVSARPAPDGTKGDANAIAALSITPNPANAMVTVHTAGLQQNNPATLTVISASGVVMKMMSFVNSTKTIQVDVSGLKSGVYTIKMISGSQLLYTQFVKL